MKYSMQGLKPEEIADYCASRLKNAGLHEQIFTTAACEAIYAITKGLPRLVNNLVTTCLLCAYGRKQRQIRERWFTRARHYPPTKNRAAWFATVFREKLGEARAEMLAIKKRRLL
ncbi:MAG: hypothetical protein IMW93_10255 [Thermoanaerobacteraceae bacterium]|nr:hypothetical protein [Thermoanaerobacteraceae bacterium]